MLRYSPQACSEGVSPGWKYHIQQGIDVSKPAASYDKVLSVASIPTEMVLMMNSLVPFIFLQVP